ncbi:glycerophosphodiester phosphodiesterase family protein [Microbulbifer sp. SAOS-129_SWC]|uniref:glycerophosphodiester phosphodiesterase family protein n=1 Tax=Microbulbifer sp. SAOS-129_SWC TaxID=3145235 RepID=UPI003217F0C5
MAASFWITLPSGAHGCAARHLLASANKTIENTQPSIDAALRAGASVVHLNIHRTSDGRFAVFHDSTLDCATDGKGATAGKNMDYLRSLDAGYGYTADGGKTFPWRGRGLRIPFLRQLVERYPHAEFWLNLWASDKESVQALLAFEQSMSPAHFFHFVADKNLPLYNTGTVPTALSIESSKRCFKDYMLYGWSRFFPQSCTDTKIVVPPKYAKYLWGWPEQFAARAQYHGSSAYLWLKHRPFEEKYDFRGKGVGAVTGDIAGMRRTRQ